MLLTNLLNQSAFSREEIIDLYFRRWAIEDHYRSEKVVLEIEQFHGRTPNSIRQELFGIVIMSVIARALMAVASKVLGPKRAEFQFRNALMTATAKACGLDPYQYFRFLFSKIPYAKAEEDYKALMSQNLTPEILSRFMVGE